MSYNNTMILKEKTIVTDENILIKLDWIKVVEKKDECYQLTTYLDNQNNYQVCKNNNPKDYQILENHFQFSKK